MRHEYNDRRQRNRIQPQTAMRLNTAPIAWCSNALDFVQIMNTNTTLSPTKSLARGRYDERGKISCCEETDVEDAEVNAPGALHQTQTDIDLENPKDIVTSTPIAPPKKKVQFAEEELHALEQESRSSAWQPPPRTPKPKNKMDGREWRKRQQIKRRVERRREGYYSEPLLKRIAKLSRALLACVPYYVDDVTKVEDPTAIGSLRSIMSVQLGFSLVLLALAILDSTTAVSPSTASSITATAHAIIDPLFVTLSFAIVGPIYLLARKWDNTPPSKVTRGLIFLSHLLLAANYALAFAMARFCPRHDPFGYGSGCRQVGDGGGIDDVAENVFVNGGGDTARPLYSIEDCILYGATSACWLILSCPVYVCISRVRATVLGKLDRLTKMEKASRAAQKQLRRFSV